VTHQITSSRKHTLRECHRLADEGSAGPGKEDLHLGVCHDEGDGADGIGNGELATLHGIRRDV